MLLYIYITCAQGDTQHYTLKLVVILHYPVVSEKYAKSDTFRFKKNARRLKVAIFADGKT